MMTLALLPALTGTALAGYGDVVDGYPSWAERELHLYTNAARVDPQAFESDYNRGGCGFDDFTSDEQTAKPPVYYSPPLNDAARFHSTDMRDTGNFSHDSSDGTSFGQRLSRFYTETSSVGENIAYGYPDNWAAMMEGWMCSSGHRENIMRSGWNELGTGVVDNYYTQDFGGGSADSTIGIRMGVHSPQSVAAGQSLAFYADWAGSDLTVMALILDGEVYTMDLLWGEWDSGVFTTSAPMPEGCADYYFVYEDASGQRAFPEAGAYLMGSSCADTWEVRDETLSPWPEDNVGGDGPSGGGGDGGIWVDGEEDTHDVAVKGCATTPTPGGSGGALALLGMLGLTALTRRR